MLMAGAPRFDPLLMQRIVRGALHEDRSGADVTTALLRIRPTPVRAKIIALSEGVLAGVTVARQVFREVDPAIRFSAALEDGMRLKRGRVIATLRGLLVGTARLVVSIAAGVACQRTPIVA